MRNSHCLSEAVYITSVSLHRLVAKQRPASRVRNVDAAQTAPFTVSQSARAGRENLTSFGVIVLQGYKHYVSYNEVQILRVSTRNSYLKEGIMALCLL